MITIPLSDDFKLPAMRMVRQRFDLSPEVDVPAEIEREINRIKDAFELSRGKRVAVGVGSRGIANLAGIVREVVKKLKDAGAKPFVTPAMGSHGGATAEGQIEVLKTKGITEDTVGAPINATMDVINLGEIDGIPLFIDRLAYEADSIVLINRIKPHTEFSGPTESGLIKMLGIGLGNHTGAEHYHRAAITRGFYEIISTAGRALLNRLNVLFGVAVVENQEHQTAILRLIRAEEIESAERKLLVKAREYLPKIPVSEIDLLIIDEMGKDISGAGIDPKIIGRAICSWADTEPWPRISRIFVRDLTAATKGHASGLGMVDFTTERLVNKIDMQATAINALTSSCPEEAKIPMNFKTDREAIAAALMTIRPHTLDELRIVHIKNSLELTSLMVSEGCLPDLANTQNVKISSEILSMEFDQNGDLISLL
ncbi:Iron-sulfur cluster-binding protein [Olavius sp. associated proteobacterium Delta 1]|nr:Iron-sulfur cluster-binding protein [Olavius sp. associated proteobacterium Delta 1]